MSYDWVTEFPLSDGLIRIISYLTLELDSAEAYLINDRNCIVECSKQDYFTFGTYQLHSSY